MTMGIWRLFISRFSKRYQVVVFDFPQQGLGDIISKPYSVSFEEQRECIEQVINRLTFDFLYVYGISWGANMAAAYVASNPNKVDKLILSSCAIKHSKRLDSLLLEGDSYYSSGMTEEIGGLLVSGFGKRVPPMLKKRIERQFAKMSPKHLEAFYAHCSFVYYSRFEDLVDFSAILAESLIVYGGNDELNNLDDVYTLQSKIKGSKLAVVRGVGHFLHLENTAVMKIYGDFYQNSSLESGKKAEDFDVSK
jgi:pimeloyl-ACP methyl ester carboxylesterase